MNLRFTQSDDRWNFKFCDWGDEETSWVLLYFINDEDTIHCWSTERGTAEKREQLMLDVVKASNEADNKYDLIDAFMYQSRDWTFWGSGLPAPIADFYRSTLKNELRKQLHS